MRVVDWNKITDAEKQKLITRKSEVSADVSETVRSIINEVRSGGDEALKNLTKKFDGVDLKSFLVSKEEFADADSLNEEYKSAIDHAIENIRSFHELQLPCEINHDKNGINCKKVFVPIDRIGLYIPGGSATLVSTLIMLGVPANIAKCDLKIVVTKADKNGKVNPAILYTCKQLGLKNIFKISGAQAVAALAYGTESIPKVDKIFGPGNKYVTEAKLQASMDLDGASYDIPAGPSEVLVICDKNANLRFVASDVLSQAEHDIDARAVVIMPDVSKVDELKREIEVQTKVLSRKEVIEQSLAKSHIIIAKDIDQCFEISNIYAPEHLIVQLDDSQKYLPKIKNAGSVFLGEFSPEACGDYASGTNHVLPTAGFAKTYGGVGVESFMKPMTIQSLTKDGLNKIAKTVMNLAQLEGLDAHKNAVAIRLKEKI